MQGLVISCEPLPPIFDCLEHNAAAHRRWWQEQQPEKQQQQQEQLDSETAGPQSAATIAAPSTSAAACPAPIVTLNVGVGDGSLPTAAFTYYPRAAGWSSMHPSAADVQSDMQPFLDRALSSPQAAAEAGVQGAVGAAGVWLHRLAPTWLSHAVQRLVVRYMLGSAQTYACPLLTVQQIVQQQGLTCIDLLKVDVERAELDVLQGVGGMAGLGWAGLGCMWFAR